MSRHGVTLMSRFVAVLLSVAALAACDRPDDIEQQRQYAARQAEGEARLRAGPQLESIRPVDGGLEIITVTIPDPLSPEDPGWDIHCFTLRDSESRVLVRLACLDAYAEEIDEAHRESANAWN